jgi:hypothetical protein
MRLAPVLAAALLVPATAASAAKPAKRYTLTLKGSATLEADRSGSFGAGCSTSEDHTIYGDFKGTVRKVRLGKRLRVPSLPVKLSHMGGSTYTTTSGSPGCPTDVAPVTCGQVKKEATFTFDFGGFRNLTDDLLSCEAEEEVGGFIRTFSVPVGLTRKRVTKLRKGRSVTDSADYPATEIGDPPVTVTADYKITVKRTR